MNLPAAGTHVVYFPQGHSEQVASHGLMEGEKKKQSYFVKSISGHFFYPPSVCSFLSLVVWFMLLCAFMMYVFNQYHVGYIFLYWHPHGLLIHYCLFYFSFLFLFFVVLEMSFLQLDLWKFIVFVLLSLIISVKEDQEILKILTWEKSA